MHMSTRGTSGGEYQTVRIWTKTLVKLRLVAAYRGERMVEIMDQLVTVELRRIQAARGERPSEPK